MRGEVAKRDRIAADLVARGSEAVPKREVWVDLGIEREVPLDHASRGERRRDALGDRADLKKRILADLRRVRAHPAAADALRSASVQREDAEAACSRYVGVEPLIDRCLKRS